MSKVLKRLYLGDVVKSFGTKQLRKLTTEEPNADPYGIIGTWTFDETIDYSKYGFYVDYTATVNGQITNYTYFSGFRYKNIIEMYFVNSDSSAKFTFYAENSYNVSFTGCNPLWSNRTITINSSLVTSSSGADITDLFATWLKANATKQ